MKRRRRSIRDVLRSEHALMHCKLMMFGLYPLSWSFLVARWPSHGLQQDNISDFISLLFRPRTSRSALSFLVARLFHHNWRKWSSLPFLMATQAISARISGLVVSEASGRPTTPGTWPVPLKVYGHLCDSQPLRETPLPAVGATIKAGTLQEGVYLRKTKKANFSRKIQIGSCYLQDITWHRPATAWPDTCCSLDRESDKFAKQSHWNG